jgi:hypothetical protein
VHLRALELSLQRIDPSVTRLELALEVAHFLLVLRSKLKRARA